MRDILHARKVRSIVQSGSELANATADSLIRMAVEDDARLDKALRSTARTRVAVQAECIARRHECAVDHLRHQGNVCSRCRAEATGGELTNDIIEGGTFRLFGGVGGGLVLVDRIELALIRRSHTLGEVLHSFIPLHGYAINRGDHFTRTTAEAYRRIALINLGSSQPLLEDLACAVDIDIGGQSAVARHKADDLSHALRRNYTIFAIAALGNNGTRHRIGGLSLSCLTNLILTDSRVVRGGLHIDTLRRQPLGG